MSSILEEINNCQSRICIIRGDLEDEDLAEIGRAIMANTSINRLELSDFGEPEEYESLFHGISQSKSIHDIHIDSSCICEAFSGIFLSESIKRLFFEECEVTVDVFAVASQNKNQLLQLSFSECTFRQVIENKETRSTKRAKVESFYDGIKVETLEIVNECQLGKHGFNAVTRLLHNPTASLKSLFIDDSLDEEWGHLFVDALRACKSLEELRYGDSNEQNLILFSSVLPELTLRRFEVSFCDVISIDTAKALSRGISQNKHWKHSR